LPAALQEDALARSVQAYVSCGQPERARAAAKRYHERFPSGRFGASVDLWLGRR
jgi:hypothetical protein